MARIASYLPFPGVGIVGELALVALGEQSGGEAMAAIALGIIPGGKLIGKAGAKIFKAIGSIGGAAWKQAKALAAQGGSFLRKAGSGLAERAKSFLNRKPRAVACGCFTASTLVWTASGAVPIGEIESGQQVLAAPEAGESWDAAGTEVGAKIVIGEASLVRLTLRHAGGSLETIDTTDEHQPRQTLEHIIALQGLLHIDRHALTGGRLTGVRSPLASGGNENMVYLWERRSGRKMKSLAVHSGFIKSLAFDPGGSRLASAAFDSEVRLWDPKSGSCLLRLRGHTDPVMGVVFTAEGEQLLSTSADGTTRAWYSFDPPP